MAPRRVLQATLNEAARLCTSQAPRVPHRQPSPPCRVAGGHRTGEWSMIDTCIRGNLPLEQPRTTATRRAELDRFLASVERRALRMAGLAVTDQQDALELVQDAMMGFVRRYAAHPQEQWPPLFWRVLDSRIGDHHRRRQVRLRWRVFFGARGDAVDAPDPIQEIADAERPDPLRQLSADQTGAALEAALRELPVRQRQAFLLRVWEGLDVATTAQAMACSEGSVKTHLFRAMQFLRIRLEAHR